MARILIGNVKHPLVNNGLTTEVGKYALDAAYGKALTDKDKELENAITQLNSEPKLTSMTYNGTTSANGNVVLFSVSEGIPVAFIGQCSNGNVYGIFGKWNPGIWGMHLFNETVSNGVATSTDISGTLYYLKYQN